MLVQHVRDCSNVPFATVVAIGPNQIGWSICCPKDHFNKAMGRKIAAGRAMLGTNFKMPRRKIYFDSSVSELMTNVIKRMGERSVKYFQVGLPA